MIAETSDLMHFPGLPFVPAALRTSADKFYRRSGSGIDYRCEAVEIVRVFCTHASGCHLDR